MPFSSLFRNIKDINRLREILVVLFEEGFGYYISRSTLAHYVPFHKRLLSRFHVDKDKSLAVRARRSMERLGPTFIKLGQILSLRPDFVSKEYIKEFEKMQDRVPEFSYTQSRSIVEKETKRPIHSIFKSFDKKPIASASLSQVHKAVLKNGKTVAVKVQRPGIREIMEKDIEIMLYIASMLENHVSEAKKYHITKIIEEFARWTERELDFRLEAKNAIRFRRIMSNNHHILIPKIYDEYTTSKLLVLEFIDGTELNQLHKIKHKIDLNKTISYGFEAILEQVFIYGFFHADPHPGNIFVLKSGKLAFVDFGIVGHFDDNLKKSSQNLFTGIIQQDTDKIIRTFLTMGMNVDKAKFDEFKEDLADILAELKDASIKDVKVSFLLEDVLNLALKHKVKMPVDFVLFGKTIATLEGVALKYDPDFKIVDSSMPLLNKLTRRKLSIRHHAKNLISSYSTFKEGIQNIPLYSLEILNKIREGKIKIDIEDSDIKRLSVEMEHSSGNIAFGMIIAALFVTSGLILQANAGPIYRGYPIIPFAGILLGFILTMWLIHHTILAKFWD
jgi:ubiquinone biosynthesis protein